ncbi:helix-turn-helix domain-containing protein [Aeromonas sp. FDAARGOS 1410]|uniref:helix-turn-helix domain-containing protein n=1 Tax=Aeromonas TaxID=642 RepID=UPI001C22AF8D|nr:helix-turn-helix transcriptional regulator [Aeromonas sp. FDAARGOS 1410]QXC37250.1 helix-turn-helix domain-containing protein [Aeromonas sp. FDAARGOS 1410]
MNSESKATTFSSITLLLLKELRLERNIHQAQIADFCGKTPSAWTKIETGRSPLSMEIFFRVCNGMQVLPSTVLSAMERYAALLGQNGWAVVSKELENEDHLLAEAQEYYGSPGFRARLNFAFTSVLNGPTYNPNGMVEPSPVFLFALSQDFKNTQLTPTAFTF